MTLTGNKLTPSSGMHLKRISDGTVAEGEMYIPSSLSVDDFTEITHEEYLQIIQANALQSDTEKTDPTTEQLNKTIEQLNKLKNQINENSTEITNLSTEMTHVQEALCEVYESII